MVRLTFLLCALFPSLAFAGEWQTVKEYSDGLLLEKRDVPESPYDEIRVSVHSKLPPKILADSLWKLRNEGYEARITKKRQVLLDTPTERVVYQQIDLPIISDRDYTIRLKRVIDSATGVYQNLFQTDNAAGPKPMPGFVRIEQIRGGWTFEPDGKGGSFVTYFFLNDPAGSLPAGLVKGYQRDTGVTVLREMLQFAERDSNLPR